MRTPRTQSEDALDQGDESILYEGAGVKATTSRFISMNLGSDMLSNFASVEAGHETLRVTDWMMLFVAGMFMAAIDGTIFLLQMPTGGLNADPTPDVLSPLSSDAGWSLVLAGIGAAAIGALLAAIRAAIWGRHVVRVETTWKESKIICESRDRRVDHCFRPLAAHARATSGMLPSTAKGIES